MGALELLALGVIVYYTIYVFLWLLLDCNVNLWLKQHFGAPISSMRGQVVWITGASSGIGRALAVHLASHGVRLVLSARRQPELEQVQTECLQAAGGLLANKDVLVLQMDMLEIDKHAQHLNTVLQHFGTLNVLVNNAGRSQRAAWEEIDVQVDRDLFELDVFAVMHLSRLVVRYYMQQTGGRGHLAVTSSVAGMTLLPFSATYCAAKHALNAYLGALKIEQPSIDVTIFCPGPVHTNFLQEAFTAEPQKKVGQSTKDQKRLTAERAGELFAVSLANKLLLTWCGLFPVNFLAYATQYQVLAKFLMKIMGRNTMNKVREGKL